MTLLDKTNTLVIVPAYNEQDSIVSVIEEIKATGYPFVVIDDGSTDETRNRAIAAGARTISLPFNSGVGGALKCGFKYARNNGFNAVIQCDSDGQHPVGHLKALVDCANANQADMVIGSRHLSKESTHSISKLRLITMKALSLILRMTTGKLITDTTSGYRIIRDPLLGVFANNFPTYYLGDTYEALWVASKAHYKVVEIEAPMKSRKIGESSENSVRSVFHVVKVLTMVLFGLHFRISRPNQSS